MTSMENFTGNNFEIELHEAEDRQQVNVSVVFQNGPCNSISSVTYNGKTAQCT